MRFKPATGLVGLAVAFAADGTTLTSAGADGVLRTWERTTGRVLGAARVPEPVALVALAPRRAAVATVASTSAYGSDAVSTSAQVRLWDVPARRY